MRIWQEAQVHTLIRTLTGTAAAAALSVALLVGTTEPARAQTQGAAATTAQAAAPAEKKPKDQGEYDLYNGVIKDVAAKDGQKALADLNTWTQKYPQSDYKDDRLLYFQSAYGLAGQPDKVVDYGAQIMAKDVNVLFKDNKLQALTVYYQTAVAITQVKSPAPELLAARGHDRPLER